MIILSIVTISCEKRISDDIKKPETMISLLQNIRVDSFIVHEFEYDSELKIQFMKSFAYHYEINSGQWDTIKRELYYEYNNGSLTNITIPNSNRFSMVKYNETNQPCRIEFYYNNVFDYSGDMIYSPDNKLIEYTYQDNGYRQHRIFEYEGNNVSGMIYFSDYDSMARVTYEVEYDGKVNPLKSLGVICDETHYDFIKQCEFVSQNNIKNYIKRSKDGDILERMECEYKYDTNDLPQWRIEETLFYDRKQGEQSIIDTIYYNYIAVTSVNF